MAVMFNSLVHLRAWETMQLKDKGVSIDEEGVVFEIISGIGGVIKREEILDRLAINFKCTKDVAEQVFCEQIPKLLKKNKVERVKKGYYKVI